MTRMASSDGVHVAAAAGPAAADEGGDIMILYASQTGVAKGIAHDLGKELGARATVTCLSEFKKVSSHKCSRLGMAGEPSWGNHTVSVSEID